MGQLGVARFLAGVTVGVVVVMAELVLGQVELTVVEEGLGCVGFDRGWGCGRDGGESGGGIGGVGVGWWVGCL